MTAVRGFVSHAFGDAAYVGGREVFRNSVRALVASACADFAGDGIEVEHDLFFEATQYGGPLMPDVRGQIRTADFLLT